MCFRRTRQIKRKKGNQSIATFPPAEEKHDYPRVSSHRRMKRNRREKRKREDGEKKEEEEEEWENRVHRLK